MSNVKFCRKHDGGKGGFVPITEFWTSKARPDGIQAYCKSCMRRMRPVRAKGLKRAGRPPGSGKPKRPRREDTADWAKSLTCNVCREDFPTANLLIQHKKHAHAVPVLTDRVELRASVPTEWACSEY